MRLSATRRWVKLEAAGKEKGSFPLLHKLLSHVTIKTRLALLLLLLYSAQPLPCKTLPVPQ